MTREQIAAAMQKREYLGYTEGPWWWDSYSGVLSGSAKTYDIKNIATVAQIGEETTGSELHSEEAQYNAALIADSPRTPRRARHATGDGAGAGLNLG